MNAHFKRWSLSVIYSIYCFRFNILHEKGISILHVEEISIFDSSIFHYFHAKNTSRNVKMVIIQHSTDKRAIDFIFCHRLPLDWHFSYQFKRWMAHCALQKEYWQFDAWLSSLSMKLKASWSRALRLTWLQASCCIMFEMSTQQVRILWQTNEIAIYSWNSYSLFLMLIWLAL